MSIFNIRVYALLLNEKKQVLITDELRFGKEMTKFPGGGLHWGEGTIDCLKRECREELGCEVEVIQHFYTTDFFQPAAFYENQQLLSIYYIVKNTEPLAPDTHTLFKEKHERTHPFREGKAEGAQSFRWMDIAKLTEEEFTFPIDKKVATMLRSTN